MKESFDKLEHVAKRLAELDDRVLEVFIHSDTPTDPLSNDEVDLVCHLADPNISQDLDTYNDEGFAWGLDMAEKIQPVLEEQGIETEVIISPFNFQMHEANEYGEYYHTLFLKSGFEPILDAADAQKKSRDSHVVEDFESE